MSCVAFLDEGVYLSVSFQIGLTGVCSLKWHTHSSSHPFLHLSVLIQFSRGYPFRESLFN
jgi:hypothetical protein